VTDDLVSWLRHQLDEDEHEVEVSHSPGCPLYLPGMTDQQLYEPADPSRCTCPARRALAEVQAKRAILDTYAEAASFYEANRSAPAGELHGLRTAITYLALPYADPSRLPGPVEAMTLFYLLAVISLGFSVAVLVVAMTR
jgi:hypothetical protein